MPIHDWKRVEPGIFHDFHHEWISTIKRALNSGLLSSEYYALAEQVVGGFGPDVLTLENTPPVPPTSHRYRLGGRSSFPRRCGFGCGSA